MDKVKIDPKMFTHYATFHGVPCYWNTHTRELTGRTWYYFLMVIAWAYFDLWIVLPFAPQKAFVIYLSKEIEASKGAGTDEQ